jgi:hypothetical protein
VLLYEISDAPSHSESSLSISDGTLSPEIKNMPMIKSSQLILTYKTTHVLSLSLSLSISHTHMHIQEEEGMIVKN